MKSLQSGNMISPISVYALITTVTFSNFLIKPDMRIFPQKVWLLDRNALMILVIATLAGFLGIVFGHMRFLMQADVLILGNQEKQAKILDYFGTKLFFISCLGYVIWFIFDMDGWLNYNSAGHLKTIAGVTTVVQLMSLALVCLFTANLLGCKTSTQKMKITCGVILTLFRSQINNERLALIEVLLPLFLVWFFFNRHKIRIPSIVIYSSFIFCFYLFFSISEYFRSWQYYRYKIDINFFSFTLHRLLDYYSTSLNNGTIYLNYHIEISKLPLVGLEFLWNFPIIGSIIWDHIGENTVNMSWSQVLRSVAGTDEFNNLHVFLSLCGDFGMFGMFILLFTIGNLYSKAFYRAMRGEPLSIVVYSILTIGVIELPRHFWFGSGRAFPIIVALIVLRSIFNKYEGHPQIGHGIKDEST